MARCSRVAVIIRDKVLGKRRVTKLGLDAPSRLSCKVTFVGSEATGVSCRRVVGGYVIMKATLRIPSARSHVLYNDLRDDLERCHYIDPPLIKPPKFPTTGRYDWCSALL